MAINKPKIEKDKAEHLLSMFLGAVVLGFLLAMFNTIQKKIKIPFWLQLLIILCAGMTIGISKEIFDCYKTHPTGFSIDDLFFDVIGLFSGMCIWSLLYLALFVKFKKITDYKYTMDNPADFTVEDSWEIVDET